MRRPRVPEPLREVLRNGAIVRLEAAWVAAIAAEWAYLVTLLVFAYDSGGVAAAGAVSTIRMLPSVVLAPFVATLSDRFAPSLVLGIVHAARAATIAAGALVVSGALPPTLILVVAAVEGSLAVLKRPTTMSLLPALARSPEELVAGNAVTSTGEAVGVLVGPVVGGLLLAWFGMVAGFLGPAAVLAVAATIVLTIRTQAPGGTDADEERSAMRGLVAGFAALRTHPSAGLIVTLFSAQTFIRGLLTVLLVAASIELLGLGEAGVGYLNSAIGAGGLVGAIVAVGLVGRRRLAGPFVVALALWGLPIAIIGVGPHPWLAFAVLGVVGVANAILDVSGFTLLQRCVPNRLRGRVFGAFEGVVSLTFGLGSLVAAPLVSLLGLQVALVAAGALLPTLSLLSSVAVRAADHAAIVPMRELGLLRGVPLFAPLPLTVIEQLARSMTLERHAVGTTVIAQGDPGDGYHVIASGIASVVRDGVTLRQLGPGDGFGEIALLDDRPRTATVVAVEPLEAYRLPRAAFLEAVTGSEHSARIGARLVDERLGRPVPDVGSG
jgi:MFS family permease